MRSPALSIALALTLASLPISASPPASARPAATHEGGRIVGPKGEQTPVVDQEGKLQLSLANGERPEVAEGSR
jgi:hypothetical protein